MKSKILVFLIGLVLFSGFALGFTMDCRIENESICGGEKIVQLTNDYNAHAATLSSSKNYTKVLCCYTPGADSITYEKNNDDADNAIVFSTDGNKNARVSSTKKYSEEYYLYDTEGGDISCQTKNVSCDYGWGCVLQTDEKNDREHAGACGGPFDTTRCCKLMYEVDGGGGQILEETEYGTVRPSQNAIVEVRHTNHTLITANRTGVDGNYSLHFTEPSGRNVTVYVKKPGYIAQEIGTYLVSSTDSIPPIWTTLELGHSCQEDCTREGSEYCDPTCVGINNCSYDSSYTTTMNGETADIMDICNMQKKGWIKEFNSTHNVECCNNNPFIKEGVPGKMTNLRTNVSNVESYEVKTVLRKGKLVTMHVSMWNELE